MNGVEAAASLFGPDDSSSDPFASLGTESATPHDEGHARQPAPSSEHVQGEHSHSENMPPVTHNENVAQHHESTPGYDGYSYGGSSTKTQDWYSTPSQWHEQLSESSGNFQATSNHWDAYTPNPEALKVSGPQSAYDPYAPQNATNIYINPSSTTYSSYDGSAAGKRSSGQSVPQYGSSYSSTASAMYTPPAVPENNSLGVSPPTIASVPVPPAPTPTTTVTRPKLSNAYDPPFPPPTRSKRVASRTQNFSSTYNYYHGGQVYSSEPAMPIQPSLPPPPVPSSPRSKSLYSDVSQRQLDGYSNNLAYVPVEAQQMSAHSAQGQFYGTADTHSFQYDYSAQRFTSEEPTPSVSLSSFTALQSNSDGLPNTEGQSFVHPPSQGSTIKDYSNHLSGPAGSEINNSFNLDSSSSNAQMEQSSSFYSNVVASPKASPQAQPGVSKSTSDFGDAPRTSSPVLLANHTPLVSDTFASVPSENTKYQTNYSNDVIGRVASPRTYSNETHDATLPGVSGMTASQSYPSKTPDPYAPPKGNRHIHSIDEMRTTSPVSQSIRSTNGRQSTKPRPPSRIDNVRGSSSHNTSTLPATSTYYEGLPASQHYQPHLHQNGVGLGTDFAPHGYPTGYTGHDYNPVYANDTQSKLQAPYAPSPSLLGSNDPLRRTSARAPVISFGFGGKVVTCFHGVASLSTGFDVALSSRKTTDVHIRTLSKVIPSSVLNLSTSTFPGPLFLDPNVSTTSLVRSGTSSQTKSKKTAVIKYLSERAEEISQGLGYLHGGSPERRQAEGKLALVKLLKVMVENDGRLSGSPSADAAVRAALVPRLEGTLSTPTPEFKTIADAHGMLPDVSFGLLPSQGDADSVISTNILRSSSLDKIQEFLLRGERRQAYHYALDEKLWAHAMIIASSVDKEAWKEVVAEFLKAELGVKEESSLLGAPNSKGRDPTLSTNGREGLRVAYSLFSGQGSAAIQEMVPQANLARGKIQCPVPPQLTPRTPNFNPPAPSVNIPLDTLSKWAETVAMIIAGPVSQDASLALTALGDQLIASHFVEAAHCCYLLGPQTSLMGGLGNPSVRIVLVGSKSPIVVPNFIADTDSIIFSEIVEFALSLAATGKGQEPFAGLPHLQAYRFIRAICLAELGEIQLANRYCEAITASLNRPSPYFTPVLLEQLRGLADRIAGITHVDKPSSWMGSKIGKPSLDSIGGWLEGRFAQLVTGDAESPVQAQAATNSEDRTFSGPFSTISSTTPSARSSPQPTIINASNSPPPRSGSAGPFISHNTFAPIDRAASALDYSKPKQSYVHRVVSAGAAVTSFTQASSFRQTLGENGAATLNEELEQSAPKETNDEALDGQDTWWGGFNSHGYHDNSSTKTPTATTFLRVDESTLRSTPDGFISLMDVPSFPSSTSQTALQQPEREEEGDPEDLGLGNSKREKVVTGESSTVEVAQHEDPPKLAKSEQNEEAKPAAGGGSWFSRWWKREPSSTQASLGDDNAFHYDPELKRWVNKKAGSSDAAPKSIPPPPPSRAQTASPSMTGPRPTVIKQANSQTHSVSAIDLSSSPPSKPTMRVRSNLIPSPIDSAPSTPTGSRLAPNSNGAPPLGRPKSQASGKRNIRSRYVDVFQQESGST
ncbi:hypothetical protein AMATHDRAFT_44853 [Amanita thiersii Skay4041]|uniref:Protein transport protein sec16 n=1 Tax=Amanita thiersii Skay4041 TaxID=703135 RepID=A0A2A9P136_9AGAR|nr:hypothetical protein AMATHDRAFT_44853 [Amanita thiersii Skay4041]